MMRRQELIIDVKGMTCAHCEKHVAEALAAVPGVATATASKAEQHAVITADATLATEALLRAAVVAAGYEPGEIHYPE
jgi:copper chaperone CopZ